MKIKINYQMHILFFICFLLFVHGAFKGFWLDELAILADVLYSKSFFEMFHQLAFEVHAPGLYPIVYLLDKLSLNSEFALRVPSLIAASLGMVAFAKIARYYLNSVWTFAFIIFCTCLSAIQLHAAELRPHIFLFAFGSWILFFLHEAMLNEENEKFFLNLEKVFYIFTVSVIFHFGSLFMIPVFFLPFFIRYRKKFKVTGDSFLGKNRWFIYLLLLLLLFFATYLMIENGWSILWKVDTPIDVLNIHLINSFGWVYYWPRELVGASFILILISFLRKKFDVRLQNIFIFYMISLLGFFILAAFGIPFGRPRYSLYLLPIPALFTFIAAYNFRLPRIFQAAFIALVAVLSYTNFTKPYYFMDDSPKILLEEALSRMQDNPKSQLVVVGDCRNLTYYLNKFQLSEGENLTCIKDRADYHYEWIWTEQHKNYVLIYLVSDLNSVVSKLSGKVILRQNKALLLEAGSY